MTTLTTLLIAAAEDDGLWIFSGKFLPNLVWTLIIFGIAVPLLSRLVFMPIARAMEERETKVRDSAKAAEAARAETEKMRATVQQELENARQEAARQVAEAKRRAAEREQELMAAAKAEAERERDRARAEIEHALRAAREQLRRDAVGLAVGVAERVIGREFSSADQQRLIGEFERAAAKN
jgi:F-type H+-transporting ATPase subunit b